MEGLVGRSELARPSEEEAAAMGRIRSSAMPHNSIHAFGKKLKQRTTKWDLFHIAFAILLSFMSSAHLFWGWSSCLSPQGLIILVDTSPVVSSVLAALSIPEPHPAT